MRKPKLCGVLWLLVQDHISLKRQLWGMKPGGSLSPRLTVTPGSHSLPTVGLSFPREGFRTREVENSKACAVTWRAEAGVVGSVWSSLTSVLEKPAQNYQSLHF